jgi:hypothetical protein
MGCAGATDSYTRRSQRTLRNGGALWQSSSFCSEGIRYLSRKHQQGMLGLGLAHDEGWKAAIVDYQPRATKQVAVKGRIFLGCPGGALPKEWPQVAVIIHRTNDGAPAPAELSVRASFRLRFVMPAQPPTIP